jgi:hypothetical protein
MRIFRTAEMVRGVSEREVLVIFVILNGEVTARNISEWHKMNENGAKETTEKLLLAYI